MFVVSSGFIGNFKLGDNVNHNLKILDYLYGCYRSEGDPDSWILRKPITILIASICEAVLDDLYMRMTMYTNEGVESIADSALKDIRNKKIDKFDKYITSAKKHGLLGPKESEIYDHLHELRRLRNRIHIQNDKNDFEPNDAETFDRVRLERAETTAEQLFKTLSTHTIRPERVQGHVADFQFPWEERLTK